MRMRMRLLSIIVALVPAGRRCEVRVWLKNGRRCEVGLWKVISTTEVLRLVLRRVVIGWCRG
jgi:hypothetical protein